MEVGVRVEQTREKGRHLVAERAFAPGDVVIAQQPYAAVLFNAHVPRFCNYCFRPGTNLRRCSRSKFAHYCSRECQLKDWKEGYKTECDFLLHCAPRVPPASIRLAAHVAWKFKKELENSSGCGDMWNSYPAVEGLVDHWDGLSNERMKNFAEMGFFITKVCPHLPEEGLSLDEPLAKSFARLLAKFSFNNHTISSSSVTSLGCGVFPLLAMANHSSWPNCSQRFNGKVCEFRAICPIEAGEEISITYVDLMTTTIEMHEVLKRDYLFNLLPETRETRHERTTTVDQRLKVKVWKRGQPSWLTNEKDQQLTRVIQKGTDSVSGALVLVYEESPAVQSGWEAEKKETSKKAEVHSMTVCLWGEWTTQKSNNVVQIARRLQMIQESFLKAEELYDQEQFKEALVQAQMAMKLCQEPLERDYYLAETHVLQIRIVDSVRKAVVDAASDWGLALECYRRLVEHHDLLYPHFWSERGSHLAALARLEATYGDIKEAIQLAQQAIHVLRVTDGGGEVLEEMKKLEASLHHQINLRQHERSESDL